MYVTKDKWNEYINNKDKYESPLILESEMKISYDTETSNRRKLNKKLIEEKGVKICSNCNKEVPLKEYSPHPNGMGKVLSICKKCVAKRWHERYNNK